MTNQPTNHATEAAKLLAEPIPDAEDPGDLYVIKQFRAIGHALLALDERLAQFAFALPSAVSVEFANVDTEPALHGQLAAALGRHEDGSLCCGADHGEDERIQVVEVDGL